MAAVGGQDISCRQWIIRGRVQGVGFRGYVLRAAGYLTLQGTVKNLADGSVEVVARGPCQRIQELAVALGRGPAFARVTQVTEAPGFLPADHDGFRVEYGS